MVRLVRGAVVALLAVLVAAIGALPSSAAEGDPSQDPTISSYGCLNPVDSYGAPQVCQLAVHTLSPVCDNDVPYLSYNIAANGSPNTTATITWLNPNGPNVVYANQPLSGKVLWPGAVPGPGGKGVDWPGWRQLPNGTWVEGDEFNWVRPSVKVKFAVGPEATATAQGTATAGATATAEATVTVAYPPSSPTCLTSPPNTQVLADNPVQPAAAVAPADPSAAVLSATGSEVQPLLLIGGSLVLIGALTVALVSIARRRRPTA